MSQVIARKLRAALAENIKGGKLYKNSHGFQTTYKFYHTRSINSGSLRRNLRRVCKELNATFKVGPLTQTGHQHIWVYIPKDPADL